MKLSAVARQASRVSYDLSLEQAATLSLDLRILLTGIPVKPATCISVSSSLKALGFGTQVASASYSAGGLLVETMLQAKPSLHAPDRPCSAEVLYP